MVSDNLVVLRTYSNLMDAQIAQGHLKSNGIESLIKNDTIEGIWPNGQHFQEVRLIVTTDVKDRADEILKVMQE